MRIFLYIGLGALAAAGDKKPRALTPLEAYVAEAKARSAAATASSGGSLWRPGAALGDIARDLKAGQVDDIVTVIVAERASAVATGTTKTSRQSAADYSITAAGGLTRVPGPLSNLLSASGAQALDGQGATARSTTLTTTLSGRVVDVLPNGFLVIEASKLVVVNAESQVVTVRGVARPVDLGPGNFVRSDRLAQLEVRINGKGVVGDAIRRPNFLYRLLLGLLPF